MANASTQLARSRSRRLLFLLVLFQLPVFRTPCRTGTCESPLHVMLGQVSASVHLPRSFLAATLFPGALLRNAQRALETRTKFVVPSLSTVVEEYNLTQPQTSPVPFGAYRLEILIASYVIVAGSIEVLFKPGRMAFLGCLLVGWAWVRARLPGQEALTATPELHPLFLLFLVLAFLSLPMNANKRYLAQSVSTIKTRNKKVD